MRKIIKTLLVVLVVVLALTACNLNQEPATPEVPETPVACEHTGGTATCAAPAVCELCGEAYGEVLAHTPGEEATCTTAQTCTVCEAVVAPALGHKKVVLPALDATCAKEGRTEGAYCKVCNVVLVEQTSIEKLEHVWVANEDRDFTCTIDGLVGGNHCENCGVQDGTIEIIPAHCIWGEEYVYSAPTCGENGILAHDCTVCGAKEKVADIPATGEHSFTVVVDAKDPTCQVPGHTAYTGCEVCGAPNEDYEEIPVVDHNFVEEDLFVAEAPTCTEQGLMAGYCTMCGKGFYVAYIPATGHVWEGASCETAGTCSVCGEVQAEPAGHDYVSGVCSVCGAVDAEYVDYYLVGYINGADYGCEADYANLGEYKFVDGKLTVTFNQDSYVFVKTGNLAGENVKWYLFESYTTGKEGTLIENKSEKMFIPGNVEVVFTLTVNEDGSLTLVADYHTHAHVADVVAPTCTVAGKTVYTCECGDTYEEAGEPALGHDYDHITHDATCTAAGYVEHICAICDDTYTDGETEALGHIDEVVDYKCDRCSTKMLPEAGTVLTIPEAIAVAKVAGSSYSTQKYYITGIVTNVYNTTYGNLYLKDAEGNQICIYGLYSADGKTRYDAMTYKPVEGDELTVYTVLGTYNSTPQGKNAWMDEVVVHEHDYTSKVTEPTCTKGGYTTHTCSICNGYYVDSETEATGHTTENGVCDVCGQTIGGDAPVIETFTADFNTVTSTNSSYVSSTTTSGWKATNCAVMGGGTSDANPKFKVFGDAATRAFTMNGKTSAKGKIVSPTLTGGISYLTFNFTNCFSESNGVDITITIMQDGAAVATKRLDQNSVTKLTAYTFEWDLAGEGVAVTGDFTIEITNNSPSNNTGNKDRVSIWNLEWKNNPEA